MWRNLFDNIVFHFQAGGYIMLPLLLISLVMWCAILYKMNDLLQVKRERPLGDCMDNAKKGFYCGASWQVDILKRFFDGQCSPGKIQRSLADILSLSYEKRNQQLVNTILILAAVAPLLGLLGTVFGMISAFNTIERFGTGNARALAEGISEALVTTQTGLVIAIPGLYMGHFIKNQFEALQNRVNCFCLGVSRSFERSPDDLSEMENTQGLVVK